MTLNKGIVTSQRSMRQQKIRFQGKRNPIEARLAKNAFFKRAVNKPAEWREIHGMIKKISEGGVYKSELRELSDKLAHGHEAQTLDHKEGRLIAEAIHEEFCPELKKYKSAGHASSKTAGITTAKSSTKSAGFRTMTSSKGASFRTTQPKPESTNTKPAGNSPMTPMAMASIRNRMRASSVDSSESADESQPKRNFSQSLAAMRKNKQG